MGVERLNAAALPEALGFDRGIATYRRAEHSSSGWSRRGAVAQGQPQDGATDRERLQLLLDPASRNSLLPTEPEDARLTGSTRSLARRLLGLNVSARPAAPTPMPVQRAAEAPLRRTA